MESRSLDILWRFLFHRDYLTLWRTGGGSPPFQILRKAPKESWALGVRLDLHGLRDLRGTDLGPGLCLPRDEEECLGSENLPGTLLESPGGNLDLAELGLGSFPVRCRGGSQAGNTHSAEGRTPPESGGQGKAEF